MFYVYCLKNVKNSKIYIGYTSNLRRRVFQHRVSGIKGFAQSKEWELVYYEAFKSKEDAQERERKLKSHGNSVRWLKERIKNSLE